MSDALLTGATGFVGRHLAARLLRGDHVDRLLCLVRAADEAEGRARVEASLRRVVDDAAPLMARIEAVPGDLLAPRFGWSDAEWTERAGRCARILHAAADVRFDQDLDDARTRNVGGTQRVVELARAAADAGVLRRLDHVSTAFVAGLRRGLVLEDELVHDAGFKNAYEQSKNEAEQWLAVHAGGLPLSVFRPSIVVGESRTGQTSNFGMLYWPMKLYARGWWRTVVGAPETTVDLVPVDFVADAIVAMTARGQPVGGTVHVAAGPDGQRTIAQLAALARSFFGGPPVRYVDPDFFLRWLRPLVDPLLWGRRGQAIKSGGRFFVPYFAGNPTFDVRNLRERLAGRVVAPSVEDYLSTLMAYARDTDFGRREDGAAGGERGVGPR